MSLLLHGDCLDHMKSIDDNSVDFIFCDLPYGQTSCKWDCCIDLDKFWIEVMRIKKINTPIFMTTTTKFGVSLINSAPKKCPFRYDLVWVKSSPAGFLSAKKMPLRKHEMIYVFYEKLPFYDLSSHKHKFIDKEGKKSEGDKEEKTQISKSKDKDLYGDIKGGTIGAVHGVNYDPPLPVSVVKEDVYDAKERFKNGKLYKNPRHLQKGDDPIYDPPLPVSVVKEGEMTKDFTPNKNGNIYDCPDNQEFSGRNGQPRYDPPLPTTMLEIKSTRGKHSTEKPVALMEWLLKYYSKEGDTVLDPTMGSGSTGVACKNMNRNFIGIEKDPEIYEVAVNRID
jgi:DNA modification methylase